MAMWGPSDYLGYITLFISAIIMAVNVAIGAAPRLRRGLPLIAKHSVWGFVPAVLMIVSLVAFVGGYWATPDYETMPILTGFGGNGPAEFKPHDAASFVGSKTSKFVVDGTLLKSLAKKDYRLIGVAFHYDGNKDILDVDGLSKSGMHDIVNSSIIIIIPWTDQFVAEIVNGKSGTDYCLLAVPAGVSEMSFSTLRQAKALGALTLNSRSGPP